MKTLIPTSPGRAARSDGFTLIEFAMVIVILGVLAAVALPRFANLREEAHTASGEGVYGAVASALQIVHMKWIAQGGGPTVALETAVVDVNPAGWPADGATLPMTEPACLQVWTDILQETPAIATGFSPGGDGWGALAAGTLCGYVYQPDTAPVRFILYDTSNGATGFFVL